MIFQAIDLKNSENKNEIKLLTADEYRQNATICTYAGIFWFLSFIIIQFLLVSPIFGIKEYLIQNMDTGSYDNFLSKIITCIVFIVSLFITFKVTLMLAMKYLRKRKMHCPYCGALPSEKEKIETVIKTGNCWNCGHHIVDTTN